MKKNITILLLSMTTICNILPMENKDERTQNTAKQQEKTPKALIKELQRAQNFYNRGKKNKTIIILENIIDREEYKVYKEYWVAKHFLYNLLIKIHNTFGPKTIEFMHEINNQDINKIVKILTMLDTLLLLESQNNFEKAKEYAENILQTLNYLEETTPEEIKKQSTSAKNDLGKAKVYAHYKLGVYCFLKDNTSAKKAITHLEKALEMERALEITCIDDLENEHSTQGRIHFAIGKIYSKGKSGIKKDIITALHHYKKYLIKKSSCLCCLGPVRYILNDIFKNIKKLNKPAIKETIKIIELSIRYTEASLKKNKSPKDQEYINSVRNFAILIISEIASKKGKTYQHEIFSKYKKHLQNINIQKIYNDNLTFGNNITIRIQSLAMPKTHRTLNSLKKNALYNPGDNQSLKRKLKRAKKNTQKITNRFTCNVCGIEGNNLKKCSACKKIYYCSTKCQKHDWIHGHKPICKKIQKLKKKN